MKCPIKGYTVGDVTFQVHSDDDIDNIMTIKLIDEGAGRFAELSIEGKGMRIDGNELVQLATWINEMCEEK